MEWLQLLRIEEPTKGQLENVEELQLMVRELKRGWVEKLASEFCKKVLMTEELKREMERLIVGA
jgi:hypothetical protein